MTELPQTPPSANQNSTPNTDSLKLQMSNLDEMSKQDAQTTLDHIRSKMERVANEFAEGKINRAQFNAIYGHHNEQRTIIEMLLRRNPENDAWRKIAAPGRTTFLRTHFESQPTFYVIFKHHARKPLASGGTQPTKSIPYIAGALKQLWRLPNLPENGAARKEIDNQQWIVLACGKQAVTVVVFSLQPSSAQVQLVRNIHADFESANRLSLERNLPANKMVYPHRTIIH